MRLFQFFRLREAQSQYDSMRFPNAKAALEEIEETIQKFHEDLITDDEAIVNVNAIVKMYLGGTNSKTW